MELKEQIESLLETLKNSGVSRSQIEADLAYSENYIDQVLAKGGNKKFLTTLQRYVLQKDIPVKHNGTLPGAITIADYKSEIEKRIAEIEARRRDAEAMYQDAKKEKGILYDLIKENLTHLLVNSNETLKRLERVLLFDRADHETIMNSQDRAEHLPKGTSTKAAGNLAVEKAKQIQKRGKKDDVHK